MCKPTLYPRRSTVSVLSHHNAPAPVPQGGLSEVVFCDQRWEADVLPLLPTDFAQQAVAQGAFARVRGLAHPALLLRALLGYVLCCSSFRHLGAWALLLGLADLSDTAWRARFVAAS